VFFAYQTEAAAQGMQGDQCAGVLVANIEYDTLDNQTKLDWLSALSKEDYDGLKQKAGGSFKYGDISLGGSYEEFKQALSKLSSNEKFSNSRDTSIATLRSNVPDTARAAWLSCMENSASTQFGLHVWVLRENLYSADINVKWLSLPPAKEARIENQTLAGGKVPGRKEGTWLPDDLVLHSGGNTIVTVDREQGKEVRGTVSMSGVSARFYVPAVNSPKYSATISVTATGTRTSSYEEDFSRKLKHMRCAKVQYWRPYELCSASSNRRPTGISRYSTDPLEGGALAPSSCFQVINVTSKQGSAPNCITANALYNECTITRGLNLPDPVPLSACSRGLSTGTPLSFTVVGTYNEEVALPRYDNSVSFSGAATWTYSPDVPKDVTNIKANYNVTVVDLSNGRVVVLNNDNPERGGFKIVEDNVKRTYALVQTAGHGAGDSWNVGWEPPGSK
jgi:hypothetical protein